MSDLQNGLVDFKFTTGIWFIHSLSPLTLTLPPHPQKSSSKITLNKTLSSLLLSPANICQGLPWVRLSLLGSSLFSLEPRKAEEGTAMTLFYDFFVSGMRTGRFKQENPFSLPFVIYMAQFAGLLWSRQSLCLQTPEGAEGRGRILFLTAGKPKTALPKCSFLTLCAFQAPQPWSTEAKISDFGEVRKFCQQRHSTGNNATKAIGVTISKWVLVTTLEMHKSSSHCILGQLCSKSFSEQKAPCFIVTVY